MGKGWVLLFHPDNLLRTNWDKNEVTSDPSRRSDTIHSLVTAIIKQHNNFSKFQSEKLHINLVVSLYAFDYL